MTEAIKRHGLTAAGALLGTALATGSVAAQESLTIGWTNWADAEAVTKLAARLLEERMDQPVNLRNADPGLQFQSVAAGETDATMMVWLPGTHQTYMQEQKDALANSNFVLVGPIYTHAKLGWVGVNLPEEIQSIEDLASDEVSDMLGGQIHGIGEGAGLTEASYETVEAYNLGEYGYRQVVSSEAGMLSAVERAVRNDEPVVAASWSPHWMHEAYPTRYLDDPKGSLGGAERIYTATRSGLQDDKPQVFDFFSRFFIPIGELEGMMAEAEESSYDRAIQGYIQDHEARVNYWVTGDVGGGM